MADFEPVSLAGSSGYDGAKTTSPLGEGEVEGLRISLDNPRVAELPDCGIISFRFKRGPVTLREGGKNSPAGASAFLTLSEICDVKEEDEKEPEPADASNIVDEIFESIRQEAAKDDSADE